MMYSDIPAPEAVGANNDSIVRGILDRERTAMNQRQPCVVQAWSNTDDWQDTRYRADNEWEAKILASWLLKQAERWIGGIPTMTRVLHRIN